MERKKKLHTDDWKITVHQRDFGFFTNIFSEHCSQRGKRRFAFSSSLWKEDGRRAIDKGRLPDSFHSRIKLRITPSWLDQSVQREYSDGWAWKSLWNSTFQEKVGVKAVLKIHFLWAKSYIFLLGTECTRHLCSGQARVYEGEIVFLKSSRDCWRVMLPEGAFHVSSDFQENIFFKPLQERWHFIFSIKDSLRRLFYSFSHRNIPKRFFESRQDSYLL